MLADAQKLARQILQGQRAARRRLGPIRQNAIYGTVWRPRVKGNKAGYIKELIRVDMKRSARYGRIWKRSNLTGCLNELTGGATRAGFSQRPRGMRSTVANNCALR